MRLSFDELTGSLPRDVGELADSGDVILISAFLAVAALVQWLPTTTTVRASFGLPFLLFVPGYALLLVLFPRRPLGPDGRHHATDGAGVATGGLGHVERIALSFGISVTLAPLVALGYSVLGIALTRWSVTLGFSGLTAGLLLVGDARRRRLPRSDRFLIPFTRWLVLFRSRIGTPRATRNDLLNVALALTVLFALSSLGYGLVVPNTAERYTDLYVVTQNGDGESVAADYPIGRTGGELIVGIDNREGQTVEYHLITQLQRVSLPRGADTAVRVDERRQLQHATYTVPHNGTARATFTITPISRGEHDAVRVVYLLYRDEVPDEPTIDDAYRSVYLWLDTDTDVDADATVDVDADADVDPDVNTAPAAGVDPPIRSEASPSHGSPRPFGPVASASGGA